MTNNNDYNYRLISDVVKEYPDMIKIYIYHNSYPVSLSSRKSNRNKSLNDTSPRSLSRTKTTISDIIACNSFDLWTTFTFSPQKVDRYNHDTCKSTMSRWLNNQRRHSPSLQYIIVPELHKDGALHFHALLKNYKGKLTPTKKVTAYGTQIYNISGYRYGFSTAVHISPDSQSQIALYVQKYITKDMIKFSDKKRYWVSTGLKRPTKTVNGVAKFNLHNIIKKTLPVFVNQSLEVQHYTKTSDFKLDSGNNLALINMQQMKI